MKQTMEERFREFIETETMIDWRIAKDFLPFFRTELALRDQELLDMIEGMKKELEDLEEKHHVQFLEDETRYKYSPTTKNLEVMKLHEGSTSAYAGGVRQGKIIALTDVSEVVRKRNEMHSM